MWRKTALSRAPATSFDIFSDLLFNRCEQQCAAGVDGGGPATSHPPWATTSSRTQATRRPEASSRKTGTLSAQAATACGQRVRNTHPDGGDAGLGNSAASTIVRGRFCKPIDGVAATSPRV